jgi:GNAT superfamily N-acetyltransferase
VSEDLARLRSLHGATAAIWSGDQVRVDPGRWVALSGAPGVDYNVALCHGASAGEIPRTLDEIADAGAPALVMVAGPALGEVQQLVEASWACVAATPFMALELAAPGGPDDAGVRRLEPAEMDAAREIVASVFEVGPDLARTALPDATLDRPGRSAWGAFRPGGELVACLATMVVEDAVGVWSMATAPGRRREGHARRLLHGAMAGAHRSGARRCLLSASPEGEPFYRSLGFAELERWQVWSRPRWVFGRA